MIFTISSKEVEIRAAKHFFLIPQVNFSIPGSWLFNWLGILVLIQPPPPNIEA